MLETGVRFVLSVTIQQYQASSAASLAFVPFNRGRPAFFLYLECYPLFVRSFGGLS
jgi:hypothetical protein